RYIDAGRHSRAEDQVRGRFRKGWTFRQGNRRHLRAVDEPSLRPVLPRLLSPDLLGYPKIKVLDGGFDAWTAKGLPVTTVVPTPAPASFAVVPEARRVHIQRET